MREYEAGIIRSERRGPSCLRIDLECPDIAGSACPGQFVQVRATGGTDPFLRRTFSLCGADRETGILRLMIDVIGPGTDLLLRAGRGNLLNLIGPLGKGFALSPGIEERWTLVAGGVGAAPLIFLADMLAADPSKQVTFLMGARTKSHHALLDGMLPAGVEVMRATDDGSLGFHGMATELMERERTSAAPDMIASCGPRPMLAEVARIAHFWGAPCRVSLEERMACGMGACLGCAVLRADGRMARVCADGPVFDAEEIAW
jgi:dihydroorotate dehydrogenase electron transfer subunit